MNSLQAPVFEDSKGCCFKAKLIILPLLAGTINMDWGDRIHYSMLQAIRRALSTRARQMGIVIMGLLIL